jgi:hypothetical protein
MWKYEIAKARAERENLESALLISIVCQLEEGNIEEATRRVAKLAETKINIMRKCAETMNLISQG